MNDKDLRKVGKAERELFKKLCKKTHADRIRAMSDEELADYAYKVLGNYCCPPEREHATRSCIIDMKEDCDNCWLDWMRQEAT